ncbi:hypothetical protein [Georgenia muralis]|uniref:ANTAR domain-containing protein n=1 Tax=Georgenia muralis TaxID=154117 RepID=A0A3N4Z5F0_9MICO|nr:hypothetical protein [Georgenia muralis]RPF28559.1 hypothetical protein EDD32_3092 [Georgenia muralis]
MLLAWRDPALEQTCSSSDAIELRWPQSADAVRRLLWTVKHCRDLAALLRHPSVRVTSDSHRTETSLSVQMRKAGMRAMALARTGEVLGIAEADQLLRHASTTTALLVADLMAEGSGSLRKAM